MDKWENCEKYFNRNMSTISDLSPTNSAFRSDSPGSPTRATLSDMLSRNKFLEGKVTFDTPFSLLIKLIFRMLFFDIQLSFIGFYRYQVPNQINL